MLPSSMLHTTTTKRNRPTRDLLEINMEKMDSCVESVCKHNIPHYYRETPIHQK